MNTYGAALVRKRKESTQLSGMVAQFLQNGGEIKVIPQGVTFDPVEALIQRAENGDYVPVTARRLVRRELQIRKFLKCQTQAEGIACVAASGTSATTWHYWSVDNVALARHAKALGIVFNQLVHLIKRK